MCTRITEKNLFTLTKRHIDKRTKSQVKYIQSWKRGILQIPKCKGLQISLSFIKSNELTWSLDLKLIGQSHIYVKIKCSWNGLKTSVFSLLYKRYCLIETKYGWTWKTISHLVLVSQQDDVDVDGNVAELLRVQDLRVLHKLKEDFHGKALETFSSPRVKCFGWISKFLIPSLFVE